MLAGVPFKHARRLPRILLTLALSVGLSGTTATVAMALEAGVHADPESPAAKEYALPLAQARQSGSGHGGGLFGAGIRRVSGRASGSPSDRRDQRQRSSATNQGSSDRRYARPSEQAAATELPAAVRAAVRAPTKSDGNSLLALLVGAAAVLVLGVIGAAVRSRRSIGVAGR